MRLCAAIALAVIAFPAAAQDALAFPEPLEAAMRDAETRALDAPRFAFTRTVEMEESGARLVARFDPEGAEGERWSLVEPAEESALEGQAAQAWANMQAEDAADIDLMLDEPRGLMADDAALLENDGGALVFEGSIGANATDGDTPEAALEALRVAITVDGDDPRIAAFRLYSTERFRPQMMVRIDSYDQRYEVSPAWEGGPLIVSYVEQEVAGSAMFQDFSDRVILRHEDVTPAR